jgi:hypothetical protein
VFTSRIATLTMNPKLTVAWFLTLLMLALLMATQGSSFHTGAASAASVTGAGFTTVNENIDGTGNCLNGNPGVNCNIYTGKQFVWLNGGPSVAYVGDGTYLFAVLAPGGQLDPNDGAAKNLSDLPTGDAYTNRTFSVSGGIVSYAGLHDFDNNKIRLLPYDDTPNPGGVYIMAICSLGDGYPVKPKDCKYDAFKVGTSTVPIPPAAALTIKKDAAGSYKDTFKWSINKDVDKTLVKQSDTSATFKYTVTVSHDTGTISSVKVTGTISVLNSNVDASNQPVGVQITGVTDKLSDGTVCTVTNGGAQTLTAAQTDFAYTCELSSVPQSSLNNTATVSWPDQALDNGAILDSASANVTVGPITFAATNIDSSVSVTDSLGGTLGTVGLGDPNPTTFTYSHTVTGTPGTCTSVDNTATFTTNTSGTTFSDSKTVKLCVGADLKVTKTATPSFTRTYLWKDGKVVDKTLVKQVGGSVIFNYTVTASETGFTDSAWQVAGTITVTNPNDWEAITANVSDSIDNGGVCAVTGGTGVSVAAGGHVDLPYTCTYASAPSPTSFTNTGKATWDSALFFTPDASATGTKTGDFGTTAPTNTVNKTVTVTDTFNGGTPTTLGTLTATDSQPFASGTYNYTHTITVPAFGCLSYTNTAAIKETNQQTPSVTVTVCGPEKTGALTMGFWQNKNGQAIITGGASTATVCNSGTWLRQFAPFQDLSATASCGAVGTYVTNVIKAANASGAAMNAMLKAQMLSTALDVYFSDPALGLNKINAPAPIGGDPIDLTQVCQVIDNTTTGTATCSGIYENVSGAFGGATSLTVSQLLVYAASQSNAGGSLWYANVKATQQLAKDTFDAINNQVAFAP